MNLVNFTLTDVECFKCKLDVSGQAENCIYKSKRNKMEIIELRQIENAVNFSKSLENENRENFRDLLILLVRFGKSYDKEKSKLPYHINLIDELHADENAHSRIFAKLLRYKENNQYPFLEKFLHDVCNFNVIIDKPKVKKVDSCGRIDIPIFDKNYVVVIENKVTDKAIDQNNAKGGQLARYIDTIKNDYRRNLEDIFVVYTPKYTREPSDECWISKENISYKDDFNLRFRSLSYRDVIYPWFKNEILPAIDKENTYLRSAVEQYIDHLEGLFSLRSINKKMNMKLQEFIKIELGLQDKNPEEATEILFEKEIELNNAINQIQQLKGKYQRQIVVNHFEKWEELLRTNYPNLEVIGNKFELDKNCINVGVKFSIENQNFAAIIECNECSKPNIYFGVGRHFVSNKKHQTPIFLQKILNDNKLDKSEDFWYGWNYTSLEKAYDIRLKTLIDDIISQIKIDKQA